MMNRKPTVKGPKFQGFKKGLILDRLVGRLEVR